MTKKRKLHELKGTILYAFLGKSKSKQWKNQPFYALEVATETFLGEKRPATIYVFPNLVKPAVWKELAAESYEGKKYLFFSEKRLRGWRLREWRELSD